MSNPRHVKTSRLEINRQVRGLLSQNRVDLSLLQFSCVGRSVRMSGILLKSDGGEFKTQAVEELVRQILNITGVSAVQGEMENWNIGGAGMINQKKFDFQDKKMEEARKKVQEALRGQNQSGGGQDSSGSSNTGS